MYSNRYDKIIGKWTGKHYLLLKRLGSGGIGEIYLVQDQGGQLLALKLGTDIVSITKEYKFLNKFDGKLSFPKVYDLDDYLLQGRIYHFFTMEYIQGYTLKSALKKNSLSVHTKLKLIQIITNIMMQLNKEGYAYTDLKLENIMIDGKSQKIRLIDMGSLVELDGTVKEYTPMYDRLSWGRGKRIADKDYQIFVIAILLLSLLLNRPLDPSKEKLEQVVVGLKRKQIPKNISNLIIRCIEGRMKDCSMLYNEISCVSETKLFAYKLQKLLDALIIILTLLLIVTIFAFCL